MNAPQRNLLSAAIALALAAGPAHAALERMGPVNKAPTVGGYPAWFQDKSGITVEFCDLKNQAELDGGWCVLIPPGLSYPESFPASYFDEHFYYIADNGLTDAAAPGGLRARLVLAIEAAFANGAPADGDQMTFGRHRVFIPRLPWDGDYRVITPFSDITYANQKAGDRIFETLDIGTACVNTFECTLGTAIGPFLLPSPQAGGAEVPPMPDLKSAPPGTDPFYDALVSTGATTPDPGTNKKYLADPARIGPVTGSALPDFIDSDGRSRNHNTFRIEVRAPDGTVIYAIDGENNFATSGRLMADTIPGKVSLGRASYKADSNGNVTDLDVFVSADPTVQARMPTQPHAGAVMPILSFYDTACSGALTVNQDTGAVTVNPPPYSAPLTAAHDMAPSGNDFWGQSQPGGKPPTHVCVVDSTARNANGQIVPAYYLENVTDEVTISSASYNGQANGTMTVNAVSSDPTAVLTLAGYGPAAAATPGWVDGKGAGSGCELAGSAATISSLLAPPSKAHVVSSKGGAAIAPVTTTHGLAVMVGVPVAVSDSVTIYEDCASTPSTVCAVQGAPIDLLANDTILYNGVVTNLRSIAAQANVSVAAQAPRLGLANITPDGMVTYTPNPNANGVDSITYTVTVEGKTSNAAALAITITPVNDLPVAGNDATVAVVSKANSFNLIAKATDPDGIGDVKDALIATWPAQLGEQPVPANGVISFKPTSTGTFPFTYQVKDAAGAVSANTATASVTVLGSEAISFTKSIFKAAGNIGGGASTRWTVTGADTVKQGQTLSIVYNDGTLKASGASCNGTATNPGCVIGTAVVDSLGNYSLDKVGAPGGTLDPTDANTWSTKPKNIKVFSSSPALGGASNTGIQFK